MIVETCDLNPSDRGTLYSNICVKHVVRTSLSSYCDCNHAFSSYGAVANNPFAITDILQETLHRFQCNYLLELSLNSKYSTKVLINFVCVHQIIT